MNKYYYLILLFTFNFFTNSQAQSIKAFPEQDNEFVQVFSSYLSSNNRPQSKEAASWITDNLLSKTSPENLQIIKKTADEMLKNRIPLWPGFYDYAIFLKTIGEQSDISTNIVSQNHQILFDFLQKNTSQSKKDFTYYLKYLTEHYQSKAIYSDRSKSWKASASYQIDSENDYPVYIFPAITLHGSTSQDTLEILETSGKYYPFEHLWKSKSGKITWKRAGFDETDVHAQFQQYELQLNQPEIQIDSATLYFYPYISTPIQGKFIDKLFSSKAAASAFPKIESYDRVPLKISNEIFLKSGVKLEGNRLVATSTGRAQPAELILYNSKNEKILEAEAERFSVIDFKRIEGRGVKLNFCYIDSTSIFHPSSALSYNIETKNLKITRENKSDARLPFVAPYFKMNLYVDQFEWDVDSNYIQLNATTAHATLPSIFESFDYYVPGADSKYQQLLNVDPIESLAYYCESMGIDRVTIDEVARVWSVGNYRHIEPLVFRMMEDGYMYYERETGMVDVFNKLFLHAKIRKDDNINYDNIRLSSLTAGRVGKLLLEDKKLEILGVEKTNLIPSGNISLEPSSDTVYISKNRDLIFKGMLTAGKFNFYSDSIQFDYDDYTFELDNIDSMLIMVPLDITDSKGNQYYTEINTPIKNISGTIYIADPENRNKSIRYSTYPYFDCNDTSTVVFNTGVFGDRYSPDHFKFNIYPFIINNLNTYETDSIKFKGLLQSDGIFENFETAISITKDRTLGLDFSTGEDPLPIFKNKALFSGHVILNQDGLTADGKIFKNNMTLVSDSILFLPDSAYALLSKWESIETDKMVYPVLKGTNSTFTWQTLNDSSFIQNESETQVQAYNNQANLSGKFIMTDKQISLNGTIQIAESNFTSEKIDLNIYEAEIINSPLAIIKDTYKEFTSNSGDVHIDFQTMIAEMNIAEDSISKYNFNNLITNYNHYEWNVLNNTVSIKGSTEDTGKYYEFVDNKLKGIRLKANNSNFDISSRNIYLGGVSEISVADSKVIPHEQKLTITDGGLIDILNNASIILNTDSSFHTIGNAQVEILNKNMMKGNGTLSVSIGDKERDVNIESFKTVETTEGSKRNQTTVYHTEGTGFIEEGDHFKLSDNLYYKGKLFINSLDKEITLEGFAKPQFNTIREADWFKIKQSLDLEKSSFAIDSLKNELGQDIYTGIMLDQFDYSFYPRIIQSKGSGLDRPIFLASGFMKNNPTNANEILFGQNDDLNQQGPFSEIMKYNDSSRQIDIYGHFPLVDIQPNKFSLLGHTSFLEGQASPLTIGGNLNMDLHFFPEVQKILARFINDKHFDGQTLHLINNPKYSHAITNLMTDKREAGFVKQDMEQSGILNLPLEYPYNTIFSDVTFTFDNYESTFKSNNDLSMLVFAGRPFIQKIKGFIEIGPRRDKDFLNMYLSTANNEWIFIRFIDGELSIITSDPSVNSEISNIKEKNRSLKSGKEIVYRVTLSNVQLKDNFLFRMNSFNGE